MEHLVKLLASIHGTKPSILQIYKYQIGHVLKKRNEIGHSKNLVLYFN